MAAKNGDEVSDWTLPSDPISPLVAPPDQPKILFGHESNRIFSTSVHLPIVPTFLNGAQVEQIRVYMYSLGSCDSSSAKWDNANNITFNASLVDIQRNFDSSVRSPVIYVPIYFGLNVNERVVFRAEIGNSEGFSDASYCCEEKQVIQTDAVASVIELPKASSNRRRLGNSTTTSLKHDIMETPYDNTRFQLWQGDYFESEIVFLARSMSLENIGDASTSRVTIDCQQKRCFDFTVGLFLSF